jgi:hypothetical protein
MDTCHNERGGKENKRANKDQSKKAKTEQMSVEWVRSKTNVPQEKKKRNGTLSTRNGKREIEKRENGELDEEISYNFNDTVNAHRGAPKKKSASAALQERAGLKQLGRSHLKKGFGRHLLGRLPRERRADTSISRRPATGFYNVTFLMENIRLNPTESAIPSKTIYQTAKTYPSK